jgi:RloB-like protein
MPRERRDFVRRTGFRDASLFVIATEGAETEQRYFNGLKQRWHNPRIHVEVLTREDVSLSSPDAVLNSLDSFAASWHLRADDQLWLVIDCDSWRDQMLAAVARESGQKGYHLAVSNPCFELWLLLHFEDVPAQSIQRRQLLFNNDAKILKKEVAKRISANKDYIDLFFRYVGLAIERARVLDQSPNQRWPKQLGTRVHLLVEQLQPSGA